MKEQYYSQYGQDQFLDEYIFKGLNKGVFVDIGAHDGITYSNTFFFEKERHWTGICFEPRKVAFHKLEKGRTCIKINGCVWNDNKLMDFVNVIGYAQMLSRLIENLDEESNLQIEKYIKEYGGEKEIIKVQCYNVNEILSLNNIQAIDYLSIDIEGGEMEVLKALDFNKFKIKALTIENNKGTKLLAEFMKNKGYFKIKKTGKDEIYLSKDSFTIPFLRRIKFRFFV